MAQESVIDKAYAAFREAALGYAPAKHTEFPELLDECEPWFIQSFVRALDVSAAVGSVQAAPRQCSAIESYAIHSDTKPPGVRCKLLPAGHAGPHEPTQRCSAEDWCILPDGHRGRHLAELITDFD